MTLIDRLKKYIKHRFSMQEFNDYKTTEGQIVTGELNIGKELMDLESMTPLDGEIIVDGKKIVVEKGIVKSIEDLPEMEVETPEVELESYGDCTCEDGNCSCDDSIDETIDTTVTEMEAPMETPTDNMKEMVDTIDILKSEIEILKTEIESLKAEKMDMTSQIEKLSNKPAIEVFKAVEPIKMKTNSKDSYFLL
jgi:FtsZ-binding cell division protein ZapB